MNHSTDVALRGALERIADGLGDNPERYDQVAIRVRRRRQRRVISGVAAMVLLVIGLVPVVATGLPTTGAGDPVGTSSDIDCPVRVSPLRLGAVSHAEQAGPLVPEDAVAVRVCGLLDTTLYRHLDRLVGVMNQAKLPPAKDQWFCTQEIPRPIYHLVFAYPDGTRVTAQIERGNCRTVQVGDQVRVQDPTMIEELLYELAERQRLADAPADPPYPTCPDPRALTRPVGDIPTPPRYDAIAIESGPPVPYPAVSVRVCRYDSTDPRTARLVDDQLITGGAEQARELVNAQGPEVPFWSCEPPAGWFDVLVFADEAGGMYEVRVGRGECELFYSAMWLSDEPEPELQRWLDDTFGSS